MNAHIQLIAGISVSFHLPPLNFREQSIRGYKNKYKVGGQGKSDFFCDMLSSGHNITVALKLTLAGVTCTSQHSTMDRSRTHEELLLVIYGCWGKASHFSLMVYMLPTADAPVNGPTYTYEHKTSSNYTH